MERDYWLHLYRDWIFTPLDYFLRSAASTVFKSLPLYRTVGQLGSEDRTCRAPPDKGRTRSPGAHWVTVTRLDDYDGILEGGVERVYEGFHARARATGRRLRSRGL